MEKIVEHGLLYDFYGELLTAHQRQIYEDAVYHDMSLTEIADIQGISRQGVHDLLRRCDKILAQYEERLGLVKKFAFIKKKVQKIEALAKELAEPEKDREQAAERQCRNPISTDSADAAITGAGREKLNRIRELSGEILEEL